MVIFNSMLQRKNLGWITLLLTGPLVWAQEISEMTYQDRPHFYIRTTRAEYLYDRQGGGFSSIKDREGMEWIGYQPGEGVVPESAAKDFRGLPNLVFRGDDNGAGHPGFDQCISKKTSPNKIYTESLSGKWAWQWTFDDKGVLLEILETDTSRAYWFLYEGIPGGSFRPPQKFWGNNVDGIRYDTPAITADSLVRGNWDWVFFGDRKSERSLFVIHLTPDDHEDNFSYMGNTQRGIQSPDGMVVFGFGRSGSMPTLTGENQFYMGFIDHGSKDFEALQNQIKKIFNYF